MKIALIGPSYPAFSHSVSAQQSLNCYTETVEAPDGKSKQVIRGRPGISLFKDCTAINAAANLTRGLFSCQSPTGGGRLFVASGTKFFEVDINGNLVGAVSSIANDNYPVDILPNGNQLFVVSAGLSYCDNGAGLVANTLAALSGKADGLGGGLVSWNTGAHSVTGNTDTWDVGVRGQVITLTGVAGGPYTVAGIVNPQLIQVTPNPGLFAAADWSVTPVLNAGRGCFIDGYFVVNRPNSPQFNSSKLRDGSTWAGLDYDYKEGYPDNILAAWAEPPLLCMLGTETSQAYRNVGKAGGTPFEAVEGGFARIGLAAKWSPVSINGRLHMLAGGSHGQVRAVRMEGVTPVRISSYGAEEAWKTPAFPTEGWSHTYEERGHRFWVIWFGGINAWVYDATEAEHRPPQECWHERAMWDAGGSVWLPYTPAYHTFIPYWNGGTHIVGDASSGKLYAMSSDYFDDAGADVRCVRTLAYVYNEGKLIYHHRFELELETGVTGAPPTVQLDWSDTRGETWGTGAGVGTKMTLGPGTNAVYTTRYFAVALGSSRGRIYRLTITGKGRVAIVDATLEATLGTS
jgi:hypothetical protein